MELRGQRLRFGSPSKVCSIGSYYDSSDPSHYHNFSADSTLDEIWFWNQRAFENQRPDLWSDGRYARPKTSSEGGVHVAGNQAVAGP